MNLREYRCGSCGNKSQVDYDSLAWKDASIGNLNVRAGATTEIANHICLICLVPTRFNRLRCYRPISIL